MSTTPRKPRQPRTRPTTNADAVDAAHAAVRADGAFQNLVTGLNTTRDRRTSTSVVREAALGVDALDTLYESDDLAHNISALPAEEMTREWIDLQGDGAEEVERVLSAVDAQAVFAEALTWSRHYGSSLIVMGLGNQRLGDDGEPDLSLPRQRGPLLWLHTYDRFEVQGVERDSSGAITHYKIASTSGRVWRIHASRVLRFDGEPVPRRRRDPAGWGQSVIQKCYDRIRDLNVATDGIGAALVDFDVSVLKVKRLTEVLSQDKGKVIQNRLATLDTMKSVFRWMTLDADDDYANVARNFGSVPDVMDRLVERVASAARIPVSLLMGRSVGGLNATGEHDTRNWYAHVRSQQMAKLLPPLRTLVGVIAENASMAAPPAITFCPLWQPTEKEKAETHLIQAQADEVTIRSGVLDEDEVRASRYGSTGYSVETVIEPDEEDDDVEGENEDDPEETTETGTPAAGGDGGATPAVDVQKTALNGAQVQSAQGIVTAVAKGEIPRDSGIALLALAFQLSEAEATQVMGSAGASFTPTTEA